MRFNPDSKKYRIGEDKALKALLSDRDKLNETAEMRQKEVQALTAAAEQARTRLSATEALVILGDRPRSAAEKAETEAQKADEQLGMAERRLEAIVAARAELNRRISEAQEAAQKRVDDAILKDFKQIVQEAVDATERAAEVHAEVAAFDDFAKRHSTLPVLRLRNYLPGHAGGQTKGGYKMSLSRAEEWICQVRGRGLAKSSKLEQQFGGIVTKKIQQHTKEAI